MERPAEHGVDHEFGQFGLLPVELELVVVAGGALVQGQGNCLEPKHEILSPASAPALLLLLLHILLFVLQPLLLLLLLLLLLSPAPLTSSEL